MPPRPRKAFLVFMALSVVELWARRPGVSEPSGNPILRRAACQWHAGDGTWASGSCVRKARGIHGLQLTAEGKIRRWRKTKLTRETKGEEEGQFLLARVSVGAVLRNFHGRNGTDERRSEGHRQKGRIQKSIMFPNFRGVWRTSGMTADFSGYTEQFPWSRGLQTH